MTETDKRDERDARVEKLRRIGIIGCLADGHDMYDGQTVSTRVWRNELRAFSRKAIVEVDTFEYKKHLGTLALQLLKCLFTCSHIVIMLSGDGLKAVLPIVYFAQKLLGKKVYHRVIGGELDRYVDNNPESARYLNGIEVNWVQSPALVKKLEQRGIRNAEFLENFRSITPIELTEQQHFTTAPFRFCTFCRVSAAKGIREALYAVDAVNAKLGEGTATLDLYGPIEEAFAQEFKTLMEEGRKGISYKGSVPSEQAVSVLKDYYMHLFPTTWTGEGFPGALIDCYNAALPTIATDWAYNSEYIAEAQTGYLYDWRHQELLQEKIVYAIEHPDEVFAMRAKCLEEAKKYRAERIVKKVVSRMGAEEKG